MKLCKKGLHDLDQPDARRSYRTVGGGGVTITTTQCRACRTEATTARNRQRRIDTKNRFMEMYGGRCNCCGISRRVFLSLDHVRGDGTIDRKTGGQTGAYARAVVEYRPDLYRILCHNCNMAMHHEPDHTCPTPENRD